MGKRLQEFAAVIFSILLNRASHIRKGRMTLKQLTRVQTI